MIIENDKIADIDRTLNSIVSVLLDMISMKQIRIERKKHTIDVESRKTMKKLEEN